MTTSTEVYASTPEVIAAKDQPDVSAAEFRDIAKVWVDRYHLDPSYKHDITDIIDSVTKDCVSQLGPDLGPKYAENGCVLGVTFYMTHPRELQRIIGLFTAGFLSLDDLAPSMREDLYMFQPRLIVGEKQARGPLELLRKALAEMEPYYSKLAMGMIYGTVIEDILSMTLERPERPYTADKVSPDFTSFFRRMLGFGRPYGWFIIAKPLFNTPVDEVELVHFGVMPDLAELGVVINDILSFYKESVVGDERDNHAYREARARRVSLNTVLQEFTSQLIATFDAVHDKVAENPQLQYVLDSWMKGMIMFHFCAPRYRLGELNFKS
ncbi:hypothetical protein EYZ11_007162 [Aspergillus tanneri]|uniref:Terpene cyclase n=1 Tax=Aspergillus tanneri TaxID=1220188 RepID=A0A4S3JDZ2_9EURO|nr:terpene cyclase [Aspergillus tanneri]KAA8652903.1 terpene cyclase [Aspergillus tanneri]THC93370.1 hypothetical protein EYZ11_007162 [Aspergillus tanneri]